MHETEQVVITQFGEIEGDPVDDAGLHFKLPFVQKVNRIEKRYLPWDGPANEMSTKKKDYLIVDTYARWRISDPKLYFTNLRDERTARSRLDDILGSETRNAVANHEIIEIIRTTKDRVPAQDENLIGLDERNATTFTNLTFGREDVEGQIARGKLKLRGDLGVVRNLLPYIERSMSRFGFVYAHCAIGAAVSSRVHRPPSRLPDATCTMEGLDVVDGHYSKTFEWCLHRCLDSKFKSL